jgi:hypothetical protein
MAVESWTIKAENRFTQGIGARNRRDGQGRISERAWDAESDGTFAVAGRELARTGICGHWRVRAHKIAGFLLFPYGSSTSVPARAPLFPQGLKPGLILLRSRHD